MALQGITALVVEEPISLDRMRELIADPAQGAQLHFYGVVRDLNAGRPVVAVSYDVHKLLAERVFVAMIREAQEKWGKTQRIALIHRVGRLAVGEISVAIAVGSPHRDEAYQASRYLIEQIKVRAPIWKKEHYKDGDSEWLEGHELCQHG
ncbi:molybdenum cofactor biosynthesis protein MoaE [Bdellovibrionota bacterium FG-2]